MKCPVCGKQSWCENKLTSACINCGFISAREEYFTADFDKLYDDSYYKGGDYYNYKEEESALIRNFQSRLDKINKFVSGGDLLEIGSGYGYFLQLARRNFRVHGVERNPRLAKKVGERLDVELYGGDFITTNINNRFDVIAAFDVIEHVYNAGVFLNKCHELLKDNGMLFLETGDIGALIPRIQKEKWRLINPPEHLNYFSVRTLEMLLNKHGFKVIFLDRVVFWRTLRQMFFRSFPYFRRHPAALRNIPNLDIPLNTFDLIFLGCRKIRRT